MPFHGVLPHHTNRIPNPYRTIEVRATVELTPDPEKAMLSKFAARYQVPVEVLQRAGGDRVIATFTPTRVVANG